MDWYYPVKPWKINQAWGIKNPIYEQFGFSRHNGTDVALGLDKRIYAPCNGQVVRKGFQPNGGGIFFSIMTGPFEFKDGSYRVMWDFLHCESIAVNEGQKVITGDIMAIADNTGFSTGPHTHIQCRRVAYWNQQWGQDLAWTTADINDANNTFDPEQHYCGKYAQDVWTWRGIVQSLILILKRLVETHAVNRI